MKLLDLEDAVKLESIPLCDYYWEVSKLIDSKYDSKPPKDFIKYVRAVRDELNSRPKPPEYEGRVMEIHWSAFRMIYDLL